MQSPRSSVYKMQISWEIIRIVWEVISFVGNIALAIWAIYERILSQRDKDYIKASIRVWQQQAQGISAAIRSLSFAAGGTLFKAKFSKVTDVGIALDAIHDVAESMSQSLYETRFFTDEELKENMKKDKEKAEASKNDMIAAQKAQ